MTDTQPKQQNDEQQKCPQKSSSVGSVGDDPQLPKREIAFYLVALTSIITYAGYGFYLTYGKDPSENLAIGMLKDGWMTTYKDINEDTLIEYAAANWKNLLMVSLGYLLVSKTTLVWTPMTCHHIACAAYTLTMTALVVSPEVVVAMLTLYGITLCVSYYSYATVPLVAVLILYVHNMNESMEMIISLLKLTQISHYKYAPLVGYLLCRLMSLAHSLHCQQPTQPTLFQHIKANFPLTLHYTFYMPYHWCGPILTYDMFRKQLETRGRVVTIDRQTALLVAWRSCRMVLWYFVLQLILHYLPVGSYLLSLSQDEPIVYKHLSFSMFLSGQSFMLAYVQFYGWSAALAKLDGIQLFHWPDCISWVYSYSIMWRVFDRGLFAVMQSHIYVPFGGSRRGAFRQILGIVASFAFVCVFHGDTSNVRAWVTLNVAQLMMERLVVSVYMTHMRSHITRYLSPQNEKRLVGYAIAWNMMISCGVIFFFLAGSNGFIVMPEFLLLRSNSRHTPVWHMLTMQFAAYCAVQIGRFYESKLKSGGGFCKYSAKVHSN